MRNTINKLTAPSSMCYFYIILLFTSMFINPESTRILSLFTITTTLVSVVILLELKNEINSRLSIHYLDFFFVFFIAVKCITSLAYLIIPSSTQIFTSTAFGVSTGVIQLIYSYILIKISNQKIKHLWLYGCLLSGSSFFLILGPYMEITFIMSIGSVYVLSQAFYEFQEIIPGRG